MPKWTHILPFDSSRAAFCVAKHPHYPLIAIGKTDHFVHLVQLDLDAPEELSMSPERKRSPWIVKWHPTAIDRLVVADLSGKITLYTIQGLPWAATWVEEVSWQLTDQNYKSASPTSLFFHPVDPSYLFVSTHSAVYLIDTTVDPSHGLTEIEGADRLFTSTTTVRTSGYHLKLSIDALVPFVTARSSGLVAAVRGQDWVRGHERHMAQDTYIIPYKFAGKPKTRFDAASCFISRTETIHESSLVVHNGLLAVQGHAAESAVELPQAFPPLPEPGKVPKTIEQMEEGLFRKLEEAEAYPALLVVDLEAVQGIGPQKPAMQKIELDYRKPHPTSLCWCGDRLVIGPTRLGVNVSFRVFDASKGTLVEKPPMSTPQSELDGSHMSMLSDGFHNSNTLEPAGDDRLISATPNGIVAIAFVDSSE
ncbi:hypothetical protein J8273_5274 [Carpediemonas membranifera]|uniref:Uncharacterized protein n=1 Tax=Carpediemonas membranifera TaxID=201153 RepID=A0A8J6ATV4_9EUKA|nr:hypothetical protein J8273_5274 [Carpediemonas membranifera]|eukprot:KAG9392285.1 hypothetical protein J8273_5274 [Carpediemonas membranifera]